MKPFFKSTIEGLGYFLPERVVKNSELEKIMDTSDAWITERTGIKERRWVEEGTTTSQIGAEAIKDLLHKTKVPAEEIDLIIATTLSPDYFFPGIGTMIQHRLGLRNIGAIDLRTQCSGFTYGLATADAFLRTGTYRNVVLIGSEVQSPVLDKTRRGRDVAVLFGDAAAAVLISSSEVSDPSKLPSAHNSERGIIDSIMGSDGSGAEILMIRTPGVATKGFVEAPNLTDGSTRPHMEGKTVFKNAVTRMIEVATQILERNKLQPSQIDLVIPHQANLRINEFVTDKLGIAPEKVFNNIQKYGNTTSATIPLCMAEAEEAGKLKKGDLVLTLSFGAGFTWGANLIRW